jgi:Uma2 family endonuclease
MTIATTRLPPTVAPSAPMIPTDNRIVFHDVTWDEYEKFLQAVGERPARVTYDRGMLEIMTLSSVHEWWKGRLGFVVRLLGGALGVDVQGYGSMTQRRRDIERGLESDECFYIGNLSGMRGPRVIDITQDPPPDLGIEVEVHQSAVDRMAIYAALGVAEVWRFGDDTLRVFHLQADGNYEERPHSAAFPSLPLAEFVRFLLTTQDLSDAALIHAFHEWLRQHGLIP